MIGYLEGIHFSGIVRTSSGVGYQVRTPHPIGDGERVNLWIHTAVTDHAITLYGFSDPDALELFTALLACRGVGPKGALTLLSQGTVDALVAALTAPDASALARMKGVGAATAARVHSEIKLPERLRERASSPADSRTADLVGTLVGLGVEVETARSRINEALRELGEADDGDVLAHALRRRDTGAAGPLQEAS